MRPDVKVRLDVTACDVRAVTVYDDRLRKEGEYRQDPAESRDAMTDPEIVGRGTWVFRPNHMPELATNQT